jgi:hypothetical protein
MNKISLEKVNSSNSITHVKFSIDDKDVGMLYLKDDELDVVLACLRKGSFNSETEVISDVYADDNADSDNEYD